MFTTTTLTRTLRTATVGGVALTLALSGSALAQDVPPPPSEGPPITDTKPPSDTGTPPTPEDGTDPVDPKPEPEPEPTPEPAGDPEPESPVAPPATPEQPATPPAPQVTPPPAGKPAVAKKKSCKKAKTKKARKACKRKRRAAQRTGVFARAAMQGVTIGTATCSGQQGQKTLRAAAPTVHAGQPFQWIEHWNTVAKWNGSTWAVDGSAWVGPFWTRTDYPGYVYYKGAWYLRSNGGGSSNHYVGAAYAVGVQWIKAHSANVVDYVYMATSDSMSVTGSPVRWCNG